MLNRGRLKFLPSNFVEELDKCGNFADVFEIVKKSVEASLGIRRSGLMLYLANLPTQIGAMYQVGSNSIILNRVVLNAVKALAKSRRELNSFIYTILLHEYLHSLGCIDELETQQLSLKIAKETFGEFHPTVKMAKNPLAYYPEIQRIGENLAGEGELEIVKDFDRSSQRYFV